MAQKTTADDSTETTTTDEVEIELLYVRGSYARHDEPISRDEQPELFAATRDLGCFGSETFDRDDTAFDTPAEALATAYVSLGEPRTVSLEGFDFDADDTKQVLDHVYARLQGPKSDSVLPYEGSTHRSAQVGDVIVVDGTPHMVDTGYGFEQLDVDFRGDADDDSDTDDEDDAADLASDEPRTAADRFPRDDVTVEPGDVVAVDSGAVRGHTELGESGSQVCEVVDVINGSPYDGLVVEYGSQARNHSPKTVSREHLRSTDLEEGERVAVEYSSAYTADGVRTRKTGTVSKVMRMRRGGFDGIRVELDDGTEWSIGITGVVTSRESGRRIGRDAVVERAETETDGDDDTDDTDGDSDEWDPQPAELRDGESVDMTMHELRNEQQKQELRKLKAAEDGGSSDDETELHVPEDDCVVITDGGECSECGSQLPPEIDEGTGVYCAECGTGQMVTDGGEDELVGTRVLVNQHGPAGIATKRTGEVISVTDADLRPEQLEEDEVVVDLDGAGQAYVTPDFLIPVDEVPIEGGVLMSTDDARTAHDALELAAGLELLDAIILPFERRELADAAATLKKQLAIAGAGDDTDR